MGIEPAVQEGHSLPVASSKLHQLRKIRRGEKCSEAKVCSNGSAGDLLGKFYSLLCVCDVIPQCYHLACKCADVQVSATWVSHVLGEETSKGDRPRGLGDADDRRQQPPCVGVASLCDCLCRILIRSLSLHRQSLLITWCESIRVSSRRRSGDLRQRSAGRERTFSTPPFWLLPSIDNCRLASESGQLFGQKGRVHVRMTHEVAVIPGYSRYVAARRSGVH